jgi:hypothetical protein
LYKTQIIFIWIVHQGGTAMIISKKTLFALFITALAVSTIHGQVDSNFYCFLLFGQSNMTGGGATSPVVTGECDTTPLIKVLAYMNCTNSSPECQRPLGRTHDTWYTAFPPLHDCNEGICPGDFFAKTMHDSIRSDIKIGLIPCALAGVALDVFTSTGPNAGIGPPTLNYATGDQNAYNWMIRRCKLAQKTGVIKGILLHQGESGTGNSTAWDVLAMQIFNSIKKDLSLDSISPCVVGELRSDNTSPSQNNTAINSTIDKMATEYTHCAVASSQGLVGNGRDVWHFTPAGFQELGIRYAKGLLSKASPSFIPRKGASNTINDHVVMLQHMKSPAGGFSVYSLTGQLVRSFSSIDPESALRHMNTGSVYLVRFIDGHSFIVPSIKR